MFQSRSIITTLVLVSILCGYAHAQDWYDSQGQSISESPIYMVLDQDSQQPAIKVGTIEKKGLWLNVTAGKKQPKSNYFTNRYTLKQSLQLDKQGYQVTVDQMPKVGDEFKRIVIMFNSNDKTACGIALTSDHSGDLVRLDTKGQFKIRKAIKFKLPATFTFVKQGDEIEIYLGE
ncbi:MAG TPA: hypothetical protein DCM28_02365, partial [Phycisphaerales bacterium]|nr:hypothetical protein [Phycisphaerales bacterium]